MLYDKDIREPLAFYLEEIYGKNRILEEQVNEWIVEFEREPDSREHFAEALDRELRAVNSDYDAKRRTTLERQRLTVVDRGLFLAWLRARGKNKVPRLVNDRHVAEEILAFGGEKK